MQVVLVRHVDNWIDNYLAANVASANLRREHRTTALIFLELLTKVGAHPIIVLP